MTEKGEKVCFANERLKSKISQMTIYLFILDSRMSLLGGHYITILFTMNNYSKFIYTRWNNVGIKGTFFLLHISTYIYSFIFYPFYLLKAYFLFRACSHLLLHTHVFNYVSIFTVVLVNPTRWCYNWMQWRFCIAYCFTLLSYLLETRRNCASACVKASVGMLEKNKYFNTPDSIWLF